MRRRFPERPKVSFADLVRELKDFGVDFELSPEPDAVRITNERWEGRLVLWLDTDANLFRAKVRARTEEHFKPAHWAPRGTDAWYYVRHIKGLKPDDARSDGDVCNFCRTVVTEIETTCPDAPRGTHSLNCFLCPSCGQLPFQDMNKPPATFKRTPYGQEVECTNCDTKLTRKVDYNDMAWKLR